MERGAEGRAEGRAEGTCRYRLHYFNNVMNKRGMFKASMKKYFGNLKFSRAVVYVGYGNIVILSS